MFWARRLGIDVYDWLGLAGFGALEYGIAQLSEPAAWIVAGVSCLTLAVWPKLRKVQG